MVCMHMPGYDYLFVYVCVCVCVLMCVCVCVGQYNSLITAKIMYIFVLRETL